MNLEPILAMVLTIAGLGIYILLGKYPYGKLSGGVTLFMGLVSLYAYTAAELKVSWSWQGVGFIVLVAFFSAYLATLLIDAVPDMLRFLRDIALFLWDHKRGISIVLVGGTLLIGYILWAVRPW